MPMPVSGCRKSLFFRNVAYSQSLSPNPFLSVKGCVCFVGSASCRAFGHTRPASVPGLNVGLPPLDPVGGYAPATPFLYNQEVYRQTETGIAFHSDARFYIQFNRLPLRLNRKHLAPRTVLLSISVSLIRSYSELIACISL